MIVRAAAVALIASNVMVAVVRSVSRCDSEGGRAHAAHAAATDSKPLITTCVRVGGVSGVPKQPHDAIGAPVPRAHAMNTAKSAYEAATAVAATGALVRSAIDAIANSMTEPARTNEGVALM